MHAMQKSGRLQKLQRKEKEELTWYIIIKYYDFFRIRDEIREKNGIPDSEDGYCKMIFAYTCCVQCAHYQEAREMKIVDSMAKDQGPIIKAPTAEGPTAEGPTMNRI